VIKVDIDGKICYLKSPAAIEDVKRLVLENAGRCCFIIDAGEWETELVRKTDFPLTSEKYKHLYITTTDFVFHADGSLSRQKNKR